MEKYKAVFLASMILLLAFSLIAYALTQWQKQFIWQYPQESFIVYHEDKTTIWNEGLEDLGILGSATQKNFWIYNNGNVPITVAVANINAVNCTYSWSSTSQTIQPNQGAWFNLTITPTGTGSFSFNFQKQ